jgi:hypothetical protein
MKPQSVEEKESRRKFEHDQLLKILKPLGFIEQVGIFPSMWNLELSITEDECIFTLNTADFWIRHMITKNEFEDLNKSIIQRIAMHSHNIGVTTTYDKCCGAIKEACAGL